MQLSFIDLLKEKLSKGYNFTNLLLTTFVGKCMLYSAAALISELSFSFKVVTKLGLKIMVKLQLQGLDQTSSST